jgi:hypothetical protein
MPYTANTLVPMGHGNGSSIWHYRTQDPLTGAGSVRLAGYFNAARAQLNLGDVIFVIVTNASNVPTGAGIVLVNDVAGANVDVTDALALTVTDTD